MLEVETILTVDVVASRTTSVHTIVTIEKIR